MCKRRSGLAGRPSAGPNLQLRIRQCVSSANRSYEFCSKLKLLPDPSYTFRNVTAVHIAVTSPGLVGDHRRSKV